MIHYVFQKVDGTGAIGINPVIPGFLLIREFEVIKGFKKIPGLRRYKRIWRDIEKFRGFEGIPESIWMSGEIIRYHVHMAGRNCGLSVIACFF